MPIQPAHAADRVEVQLSHPIVAHGETVDVLRFRRPTAGDLEATDGLGDVAKVNKLIERLAAIPRSSVLSLDAADYPAISEVIAGFFGNSRATGETS